MRDAYFRIKLDQANRLLLSFVRFLRGARVDEVPIEDAGVVQAEAAATPVRYPYPGRGEFHLLDKSGTVSSTASPTPTSASRRSSR